MNRAKPMDFEKEIKDIFSAYTDSGEFKCSLTRYQFEQIKALFYEIIEDAKPVKWQEGTWGIDFKHEPMRVSRSVAIDEYEGRLLELLEEKKK